MPEQTEPRRVVVLARQPREQTFPREVRAPKTPVREQVPDGPHDGPGHRVSRVLSMRRPAPVVRERSLPAPEQRRASAPAWNSAAAWRPRRRQLQAWRGVR